MLKTRIIFQFIEKKTFLKCQLINLDLLYTFVDKIVDTIYYSNLVLESLQALLTDIWADNASAGFTSHDRR